MQSSTAHRIVILKVNRDGWTRDGETDATRPPWEVNGPGAVITAALRFTRRLRSRADDREYVLIAQDNTIWGVGKVVRVVTASEGVQFHDHPVWPLNGNDNRGFLVDPFDVPQHIVDLIGTQTPENIRTLAYGLLIDGEIQLDSRPEVGWNDSAQPDEAEQQHTPNLDKSATSKRPLTFKTIDEANAYRAKHDEELGQEPVQGKSSEA